jgi:polyisoprenoid-binding protein YceI
VTPQWKILRPVAYGWAVAELTGTFRLGPDNGRIILRTGRIGFAARAGHDLTMEVTRWSARVEVPGEDAGGVTAATVTAELDLGSVEVREGTGGVKPLTDSDRREIKKTMAGIHGDGKVTFTSSRIIRSGATGGAIEGTLTINGHPQPFRLQVTEPEPGRYRGSATVVQSAFGIKPYVGFFGALKVRDEVAVEFEVNLAGAQDAELPGLRNARPAEARSTPLNRPIVTHPKTPRSPGSRRPE